MTTRPPCSLLAAMGHNTFHLPPCIRSHVLLSLSSRSSIHPAYTLLQAHQQPLRHASSSRELSISSRKVNPPLSTLPAPLEVAPRAPDQAFLSYAYKSGKSYLAFYKSGIKNIWQNHKTSRSLQQRLRSTQTPQLPPAPARDSPAKGNKRHENLYSKFALTRAEFQFLRRNRYDISRVPVFAVLFLLVGEWLPLIVIFFTPLVPYTCRIPRQVEKSREKLEARRRESFRGAIDGVVPTPAKKGEEKRVQGLEDLNKGQLMHISRSLNLHGRIWDWSRGVLPLEALLRWKVKRWLGYLEQDDALLVRDGGVRELSSEELRLACEQRGIDVLRRKDEYLRSILEKWLKGRREGYVLSMLLSRPS